MPIPLVALLAISLPAQDTSRLTLEAAVGLALERAPSVEAARQALAGARGSTREAKAQWFPLLAVEGSAFRHEEEMLVAPIHTLALTPGTPLPPFDQTLVQGNLSLGWTLYDGGIRSGRIAQSGALEDAARAQTDASMQALIASVVRTYAEVQAAREAVGAEEHRRTALAAELTRVNRFLTEGRAARLEELRVNAAAAAAEADRASAQSRLEVAQAALARLVGLPLATTQAAQLQTVRPAAVQMPIRDSLLQRARATNPGLQAAASRAAAADAAIRTAGAAWYPTVRLDGRLVSYGSASGNYSTEWQAGARVAWPIFTGGSRGASVDRAEAAALEARAQLAAAELDLFNQVDQAAATLTETERRIAALEAAVGHLTEAQRVEALALEQGAGTQADFLRAEADLAAARSALAQARAGSIAARAQLAQLTGTLTPGSLADIVTIEP